MLLTLFSPAKINLFLRVLKKRADGYHELATLIQAIDLGDTLTLKQSIQDQLTCNDPLVPNESNLVRKAIALFRRKTGCSFGVHAHLEKQIPMQAGLGGGSSNAATTLWGLNVLAGFPASNEELQTWSSEIGSDIPFFFSTGTAYCTGRGEKVRSLPLIPIEAFIVKPPDGLSTPRVFQAFDLNETYSEDPEELLKGFQTHSPCYYNDLEKPAFKLLPTLKTYKDYLLEGSQMAAMTGSGTAFFCLNPRKKIEGSNRVKGISRLPGKWYLKDF